MKISEKEIFLFDIDNTILDFDMAEKYGISNVFEFLGFKYTENDLQEYSKYNQSLWKKIEQGEWLSDAEYGTIHRVASDGRIHGMMGMIVQFCSERITHLRIDTHADNKIMQHLILKNGFKRCGIIYISDGSPRIAYERI